MISQTAEYALRAVVALGLPGNGCLTTRELAKRTQVSAPYLAKVLLALVHAGLVASHRGLGGGFDLARSPARMTVLEVVIAVAPHRRNARCPAIRGARPCPLCGLDHAVDVWLSMTDEMLARYTVADVIAARGPSSAPGGTGLGASGVSTMPPG